MNKNTIFIRRAIAYLIDSLLAFLVFVVLTQTFVFVPAHHLLIGSEDWFRSGWNLEEAPADWKTTLTKLRK